MKKLFLYLTILAIVFFTAFYLTRNFFSEKGAIQKSSELDASDISNVTDVLDIPEAQDNSNSSDTTSSDSLAAEAGILNNGIISGNNDQYIVGIKNGHVIVYINTQDNIYEYTGVDADVIKSYNKELYDKLKNNIYFDSVEDLFNFLESIAS